MGTPDDKVAKQEESKWKNYICFALLTGKQDYTATSRMKPDGKYRMWSVATQNFLRLKENGDNIQAEFTGNGNEQSSKYSIDFLFVAFWLFARSLLLFSFSFTA